MFVWWVMLLSTWLLGCNAFKCMTCSFVECALKVENYVWDLVFCCMTAFTCYMCRCVVQACDLLHLSSEHAMSHPECEDGS